jgi:hypothetical protein
MVMATPAKRPAAKRGTTKKAAQKLGEGHTPSEAVALAILGEYGDLAPSVNRILASDLGEEGRLHAITLFQASLGVPGDPNRIPATAIEAGRRVEAAAAGC